MAVIESAALPNRPSSRELLVDRVRAVGRAWDDEDERRYELRQLAAEALLLARMVEVPAEPKPPPPKPPQPPPKPKRTPRPQPAGRVRPTTVCEVCGAVVCARQLRQHQLGASCR